MFSKKRLSLLFCFIVWINPLISSVIANTLIKTPHEYIAAENLALNGLLLSYDKELLCTVTVTHISQTITNKVIAITTTKGTFHACPGQQFFDPVKQEWITAENITTQTTFLDSQLNHCPCLHAETISIAPITTYRITTTYPHTFFITEQELLVHNAFPVIIGLAWLFGGGLEFVGVTLGTAVLGSYIGIQLYNAQKQKTQDCNIEFHVIPCGSPCPNPNDDENERKFNTISKTEFFRKIEEHYERWRGNTYKRKHKSKGIEDAEYLEWDHTHNDVEAYGKNRCHKGSINPSTLKIYKPAVPGRKIPK